MAEENAAAISRAAVLTQQQAWSGQLRALRHQRRLILEWAKQEQTLKQDQAAVLARPTGQNLDYSWARSAGQADTALPLAQETAADAIDPADELRQSKLQAKAKAAKHQVTWKTRALQPIRLATSKALVWAWRALIPSYGLTFIYIDLHGFGNLVLGQDVFCEYGQEWLDKPAGVALVQQDASNMASNTLGIAEKSFVFAINIILATVIFALITLFIIVSSFHYMATQKLFDSLGVGWIGDIIIGLMSASGV